ncbi:DUF2795 domain-containing protein [Myxococcus sp. K15C18031901]|uniref:DUF2795 domain-containing protein n=1 Tax=Myxococcus dinghuensis TaxID=2906761 RepID=UPI0020A6F348|nr:DUF2795 domain-containing protein [Myxococcus dinghuensis]MCP3105424.1 DUF2795 domain-containing protein [Myxococcus dinghuensis]
MTRERFVQGVSELEARVGLHEALGGAVFPLTREELSWVARENEASATVLSLLAALPPGEFSSLEAVAEALQKAPAHEAPAPDARTPAAPSAR